MKKIVFSCIALIFLLGAQLLQAQSSVNSPYRFIKNKGQWHPNVQYKALVPGGAMFFENSFITYRFYDQNKVQALHNASHEGKNDLDPSISCAALRIEMLGASDMSYFMPEQKKSYYENYYLGNDPKKWASKVPTYGAVEHKSIYPGIDMRFYEAAGFLKYDIKAAAGSEPSLIQMKYRGAKSLNIDEFGNLIVNIGLHILKEEKPFAYQIYKGDTINIPCNYKLVNNTVSFDFPIGFNSELPLVIDPLLIFSTYSGSFADNFGFTATYDSKGYLYSGGNVFGVGYDTTSGAFMETFGGGLNDVAISKYDTTGTFMIYSSYLGGSGAENPHSLIVNNYDELFVLGSTGSSDFPVTANAFDPTFNAGVSLNQIYSFNYPQGCDMFISRFSADGSQLNASTYLGGTGNDGINPAAGLNHNYADIARGEIDIDKNNFIYIASTTASLNFPGTTGSFQPNHGGGLQDGIIVKMDNGLTSVIWASYLGGSQNDAVYSLALDESGDVIVGGGTNSPDFPATGATFNTFAGVLDGFVSKIKFNGTSVIKTSLYGSSVYDQIYFVERDKAGDIFVFGQTNAPDTAFISNVAYSHNGGNQFITKFNSDLDTRIWSTAFGLGNGHADISPAAFLVDVCNKIYVSGWGGAVNQGTVPGCTTTGMDISSGAYQSTTDGSDFYLMVIDDNANNLIYSTFFGGPVSHEHVDGGTSRFNRKSEIYQSVCAGCGNNDDFPHFPANAWSATNNSSNCNNGVFKFKFDFPQTIADFGVPPAVCAPATAQFNNLSIGANNYIWDFGGGNTSNLTNPTFTFTQAGVYEVSLIAIDSTGLTCNTRDTIKKQIYVIGASNQQLSDIGVCTGVDAEIGLPPSGDPTLTFSWIPSAGLSDPSAPNPVFNSSQGTTLYQLIISNGVCTDTLEQQVTVAPLPQLSLSDTIVCTGQTLNVGFPGSFPGVSFVWHPGSLLSDSLVANPSITLNQNMALQLVYSVGSCSDTVYRNVNVLDIGSFSMSDTMICAGDTIQIHEIPNFPGVTYQWSPNTQISGISSNNPLIWPSANQTYTVIISNGICSDTASKNIQIMTLPAFAGNDKLICKGDSVLLGPSTVNPGLLYSWNPSTALTSPNIANPYAHPVSNTQYILTVQSASNPGQCVRKDTVLISVFAVPAGGFTVAESASCDGVGLQFTSLVGSGATYQWILSDGQTSTTSNPSFFVPFNQDITVSMVVSAGNCKDTVKVNQTIYGIDHYLGNILIPDIFTPKSTPGINDCFAPVGLEAGCYEMVIYNRWGNLVFDSFEQKVWCWDGTFYKTSNKVSDGVYFYIIDFGGETKHGTVSISSPK